MQLFNECHQTIFDVFKRHFVTMLTSEKPDIERIYMETPTVTEGPGSI